MNRPRADPYGVEGPPRWAAPLASAPKPTLQDLARLGGRPLNNPLSSMVSSSSQQPEVCKDFLHGSCTRGDSCRFAHEELDAGAPADSFSTVCRYFLAGTCSRGETCKFSHDLQEGPPALEKCRYFANGTCERGESCKFSHADPVPDPCKDFIHGSCTRGDTCIFSHDPDLIGDKADTGHYKSGDADTGLYNSADVCRDFQQGYCVRGEECRFSHHQAGFAAHIDTFAAITSPRRGAAPGTLEVILAKVQKMEEAQIRVEEQLEDIKNILSRLL